MNVAASSPEEVARLVRDAGGLGVSCFRHSACEHLHLDLRPMRALRFHQPGDLTVGADAGMTVAELNQVLSVHGQFVPLDVPRPESTTLGAVLSRHLSGPLRQRFGTVRDFTLGLEMAAADGKLVHCGGRVVKNVAGYDWMKPVLGARGAIGIITGVNFKVFPLPAGDLTARFARLEWPQVEALRSALLHSPLRPLAIELRATGAGERSVLVRCAGTPTVLGRCRDELARLGRVEFDGVDWSEIASFPRPGDRAVSFPPAQAVAALAGLGSGIEISGRLGQGVYWIRGATLPPPAIPAATLALMKQLKAALDPAGLLHGEACAA